MGLREKLRGSRRPGVVRSPRAWLAGLGTTGSLLAGAALMFILASAIVGFRGWPQVGAPAAPANVVVTPAATRSAGPSRTARRLALLTAAPVGGRATGPGVATRPAAGHGVGTSATLGTTGRSVTSPGSLTSGSGAPGSGSGSGSSGSGAAGVGSSCAADNCGSTLTGGSGGGGGATGPVQPTVHQVATGLGNTVASTGNATSTVVQQTTSAVAGTVSTISPQLGTAVQSAGNATGKVVTGVTNTVAGALTGQH